MAQAHLLAVAALLAVALAVPADLTASAWDDVAALDADVDLPEDPHHDLREAALTAWRNDHYFNRHVLPVWMKRSADATGMSLSIVNNMDVLRSKLLRELVQRRENINRQSLFNRNKEILADIGR